MPLDLMQLPLELLAAIATFTDASDALALAATCHKLRLATWDSRVFRDIIRNRQIYWPPMLTNGRLSASGTVYEPEDDPEIDISAIERTAAQDTTTWAKFAIANEYANRLQGGLEHDLKQGRVQSILRWAPHMVLYHQPFVSSLWLTHQLYQTVFDEPFELERAFLFASCMLGMSQSTLEWLDGQYEGAMPLMHRPCRIGTTVTKTYRALGSFAYSLRYQQHTNRSRAPRQPCLYPRPPPSPSGFAYPHPPIPFGNSFEAWHEETVRALWTIESLISGTWVGYYSYLTYANVDEPMVKIKFQPHNGAFIGHGMDGLGPFQLTGDFGENFTLGITKDYSTHQWNSRLRMTPFGMFGTWHRGDSSRVMGCLWFWKEEWMTQKVDMDEIGKPRTQSPEMFPFDIVV